jgi:CubicO group peptidase (beta-lactamase class C family)
MTDSLVFLPYKEQKMKNRAYGYVKTKSQKFRLLDSTKMDGVVGHDGVYSTLEDLFKWDQALYTEKLVSKSTLEEAFTPGKLNNGEDIRYGFGWALSGGEDKKYVSHGGSWVGFKTYILREINSRIVVIVLTNNTDKIFGKLIKAVYQGFDTD